MRAIKDLFYLFFPERCFTCDALLMKSENLTCTLCLHDLPFANYTNLKGNNVEQSFYGRIPVFSATALLLFHKKSNVQKLIHLLKYKGKQEIGAYFGDWLGQELLKSDRFESVEMVIPVPLHPKKLRQRGYNQVAEFGKSIAKILQVEYVDNKLIKVSATVSQTRKHRAERVKNVNEIFTLIDTDYFINKHILLVDDVITTGSTLEVCCNELLKTKGIKISIAALSFTA